MQGRFDEPVDYAQARDYLEKAPQKTIRWHYLCFLKCIERDWASHEMWKKRSLSSYVRLTRVYALAQHNAAVSYVEGIGVEVDIQKGFDWFRRASDAGYASQSFH